MVRSATLANWRPMMYVIPYDRVARRVKRVEARKAASLVPEYIVPDLTSDEFSDIELMPWR